LIVFINISSVSYRAGVNEKFDDLFFKKGDQFLISVYVHWVIQVLTRSKVLISHPVVPLSFRVFLLPIAK